MLDKSPEQVLDNNLVHIQNEIKQNIPSIISCSEPFYKIEFLNKLIDTVEVPIMFVDTDFLYSGYVESKMIQKKDNLTIFHPNKSNWKEQFLEIIDKVSKEKILVVIDSLNGIYNIFDDLESARVINSTIMLLSYIGRQTNSPVVITAMVRKKDNELVLLPGGKQIIQSRKTNVFSIKKIENSLLIEMFVKSDSQSKIFKIG